MTKLSGLPLRSFEGLLQKSSWGQEGKEISQFRVGPVSGPEIILINTKKVKIPASWVGELVQVSGEVLEQSEHYLYLRPHRIKRVTPSHLVPPWDEWDDHFPVLTGSELRDLVPSLA